MNRPALPSLEILQSRIRDYLQDPQGKAGPLAGMFRTGGSLSVPERLQIYHQAYRWRLVEALQDSYEPTWTYLGDERFNEVALHYVENTPPVHDNIRWYGAGLPDMLAEVYPDAPEIAELARLGWTLRLAFDAGDAPHLGLEALQQISPADWASVGFALHPAVHLLQMRCNTLAIWQALDRSQTPPPAQALDAVQDVLVWRNEEQPHFMSLGPRHACALRKIRQGHSFAGVCAAVAGPPADGAGSAEGIATVDAQQAAVQEMGGYLRQWLDLGLLQAWQPAGAMGA